MQYIVLLRGVNVGGRKIPMAELKFCLENAGYKKVNTVLQTGNVILESEEKNKTKLHEQIETLIARTFDYPARILILQPKQLEAIIQDYPFKEYGLEFHRYIVFTKDGYEQELVQQAGEMDKAIEIISAGHNVVYWSVLKGHTLDSSFGKYMNKAAHKYFITNRNVNTLEKILKKIQNAQ